MTDRDLTSNLDLTPAKQRAAQTLIDYFKPLQCDSQGASDCIRCTALALARWMLDDLARLSALQADLDWIARMGVSIKTMPGGQRYVADELKRSTDETSYPRAPRANVPDSGGWTLDPVFLSELHESIRGDEFAPSDEGIELVILAFEQWQDRQRRRQEPKEGCAVHATEHRMRNELPCPWCVIDELKRNRATSQQEPKDLTCLLCLGSGTIQVPDEEGPNAHPMDIDCPRCKGTGATQPQNGEGLHG